MRFFERGLIQNGYGDTCWIILNDDENEHGVFSISIENGTVTFYEECDGYYSRECTKNEAIQILEEALGWVRNA